VRTRHRRCSLRPTHSIHLVDAQNAGDSSGATSDDLENGRRRLGGLPSGESAVQGGHAWPHARLVVGHGTGVPIDG
jgi:hypothetical protein